MDQWHSYVELPSSDHVLIVSWEISELTWKLYCTISVFILLFMICRL